MSTHIATVHWKRQGDFDLKTYSRAHEWHFEGGEVLRASSAPDFAGDADLVDPEQAFTASLSSCHMLTFLALACKKGFVIDDYKDRAVGELGKNTQGQMAMTKVTLNPQISFSGDKKPTAEELANLHEQAHKYCFIANSVTTEVVVAG